MKKLALVTGASAGIGREIARLHAARGGDLIVTARRAEALEALAAELKDAHGTQTQVIARDLAAEGGAKALIEAVGDRIPDYLVNNAGFGGAGAFVERDLARDLAMIDLNVARLVELCHHYARAMKARGSGRILNVGSTAGFVPGPFQATYYATKAFVNSFSQALDEELREHGVTVSVLAPGYVETEFADTANMRHTDLVKAGGADAASVAKVGYDAMLKGDLVAINDRSLAAQLRLISMVPRRTVLKMIRKRQQ
ncbi:MAG: SDR family NAD(P)-dependent oxidoreductase [Hasllibacter sp.]